MPDAPQSDECERRAGGWVMVADRPYYPSVTYHPSYETALAAAAEWAKAEAATDGKHRSACFVAQIEHLWRVRTDY